jgi:hypothetical protein
LKLIPITITALLGAIAPALAAPDYAVIHMEADVNKGVDQAWAKISDYCLVPTLLGVTCAITTGSGDIGTNRKVNGMTDEVMVAKTAHSYTYAQPASPIFYHATMALEPVDAGHSKIVYTLFYDQAPLATPDAQAANRKQRTDRFTAMIVKLKAAAEAP